MYAVSFLACFLIHQGKDPDDNVLAVWHRLPLRLHPRLYPLVAVATAACVWSLYRHINWLTVAASLTSDGRVFYFSTV